MGGARPDPDITDPRASARSSALRLRGVAGQAVESLLEQTRPPQRIVVIDDASPVPPIDLAPGTPT
jgi:hypothetical protein